MDAGYTPNLVRTARRSTAISFCGNMPMLNEGAAATVQKPMTL